MKVIRTKLNKLFNTELERDCQLNCLRYLMSIEDLEEYDFIKYDNSILIHKDWKNIHSLTKNNNNKYEYKRLHLWYADLILSTMEKENIFNLRRIEYQKPKELLKIINWWKKGLTFEINNDKYEISVEFEFNNDDYISVTDYKLLVFKNGQEINRSEIDDITTYDLWDFEFSYVTQDILNSVLEILTTDVKKELFEKLIKIKNNYIW